MGIINIRRGDRKRYRKLPLWRNWVRLYIDENNPMSAEEIAARYVNPRTGRPYSPQMVYFAIREFESGNFKLED